MRSRVEPSEVDDTQRTYARLAGILFLGVIILALGASFLLSGIAGSGTFAATAKRIAASQWLYRIGLSTAVVATLVSIVLPFALYATLKPANPLLAQLGMIFILGDSFLGLVVRTCGFVRMHLYMSALNGAGAMSAQAFSDLVRSIAATAENIGGICFGTGLIVFFYLFFEARYIPKVLSALGLAASAIWTTLYLASLVFPEQRALFQYVCFPPMALADVSTGVYLMLFRVKASAPG